jgi:hypothetical protein
MKQELRYRLVRELRWKLGVPLWAERATPGRSLDKKAD